jgi:putative membrane protein
MTDLKSHRFTFLQRLLINTLTLLALAGLFPNGLHIANLLTGVIAALVLAILNALVRPFLQLLAFPLTLLTFGLFGLVINGFVLWMTSVFVGPGFQFASFGWAVIIAVAMSIVNMIVSSYFGKE